MSVIIFVLLLDLDPKSSNSTASRSELPSGDSSSGITLSRLIALAVVALPSPWKTLRDEGMVIAGSTYEDYGGKRRTEREERNKIEGKGAALEELGITKNRKSQPITNWQLKLKWHGKA